MANPPEEVDYSYFQGEILDDDIISWPAYDADAILEAFDTPLLTTKDWIYTGSNFTQMACFELLGHYPSRELRLKLLHRVLERPNCKKIIFPSKAGMDTMHSYGKTDSAAIQEKTEVIPYAFREVDDSQISWKEGSKVRLLFVGSQFLLKGGRQLLDAFERLDKKFDVELRLVTNFASGSKFGDKQATEQIRERAESMDNVMSGPVKREDMLASEYPKADIFVVPTLSETYGYANIEAMGYGLPVVSTNWPESIPEIVEHEKDGFLIDIMNTDFMKAVYTNEEMFKADGVYTPPKSFDDLLADELYDRLAMLIDNTGLRKKMGRSALMSARTKFSFKRRNKKMKEIYEGMK